LIFWTGSAGLRVRDWSRWHLLGQHGQYLGHLDSGGLGRRLLMEPGLPLWHSEIGHGRLDLVDPLILFRKNGFKKGLGVRSGPPRCGRRQAGLVQHEGAAALGVAVANCHWL
jgi:hypothetical protein